MLPKIIFLDMDGPVITTPCYALEMYASIRRKMMSTAALGWLKLICKQSGAKIVTNSTHNIDLMVEDMPLNLKEDLIKWGIPEEMFHENWRTKYPNKLSGGSRMGCIEDWLEENGPHDWICFDDMEFTDDPRLILCNMDDGITSKEYKRAAELFKIDPKKRMLII